MAKISWTDRTDSKTPTDATTEMSSAKYNEIKTVVNANDTANTVNNIAFGTSIPFSNVNTLMAAKIITQANIFTKNVTDQITFGACQLQLTANGNAAHVPDFSAFKKTDNGIDWDNTLDVLNLIYTWYDGITHRYLISRAEVGPKFISAVMAVDNSKITTTLDKASYTSGNGTGALVLADFAFAFAANGGTATGWNRTSITKVGGAALVGGETVIEIHGTTVGTADGNETVTITPVATAIFDSNGNAMDVGESVGASVNLVVAILMQDDFAGVTPNAANWPTINNPDGDLSQNNAWLWDVSLALISAGAIGSLTQAWISKNIPLSNIVVLKFDFLDTSDVVSLGRRRDYRFGLKASGNTDLQTDAVSWGGRPIENYNRILTWNAAVIDVNNSSFTPFDTAYSIKYIIDKPNNKFYIYIWNGTSWILQNTIAADQNKTWTGITNVNVCLDVYNGSLTTATGKFEMRKLYVTDGDFSTLNPE